MLFNPKCHLEMIDARSKMSLKMSCLQACDNNVARAKELYEFLSADIGEIPDLTPIKPGGFEQVKQGASDVLEWVSSHKDDIVQGVSFIQSLRKPVASSPSATIPPIPKL